MSRESDEVDSEMKLEVVKVQRERESESDRKEETNLDNPRIQGKYDKTKPRAKRHKRSDPKHIANSRACDVIVGWA